MANKLHKPLLIDSILATENLVEKRFISFDGTTCTAGAKALGVSTVSIDANQYTPIGVLGIFLVEAGGNISVGDTVTSDARGKAVVATESDNVNGYAQDEGIAGDVIRIVRGI